MRAIWLALLFLSGHAYACSVEPDHFLANPDELIARTSKISLATVIRAEVSGRYVLYTFRTVCAIKGNPGKVFQLRGEPSVYPSQHDDFDGHSRKQFWSSTLGRLTMHPDCKVHPSFSVGGTYLTFLDQPYHAKSFELIRVTTGNRQDKWLKYVIRRTGP